MSLDRVVLDLSHVPSDHRGPLLEHARRRGFRRFLGEPADRRGSEVWYGREGEHSGAPEDRLPEERTVARPEELAAIVARLKTGGSVMVRWEGERVLPLETLVAVGAPAERLWVRIDRPAEVPSALGALEHGAGYALIAVGVPEEIDQVEALVDRPLPRSLDWVSVEVAEVHPSGPGDRVIVDTTSLLGTDEGLLVGSVAGFLFHVVSEAIGSRYTRPRPFRVNAGAPHSYVLLADGTTRYLSELVAGDRLLAVRPGAGGRVVRVGRLKIERRSLTLVRGAGAHGAATLFVQEAETVRLSGEAGPIEITRLRPGDRLRGVRAAPARHLGVEISEQIEER